MSALCEVWGIMNSGLGLGYEEIADIFEQWNTKGELVSSYDAPVLHAHLVPA